MKNKNTLIVLKACICFLFTYTCSIAQNDTIAKPKNIFWSKVRFGGGLGLGFGNGYTNVAVSPTMYYPIKPNVMMGIGGNVSYIKNRDIYSSMIYGGSLIALANPIEYIQTSIELEQLRVNNTNLTGTGNKENNFWNTAIFLGAGYRSYNFTIGIRYNILYRETNNIYTDAWMPFVRVMF